MKYTESISKSIFKVSLCLVLAAGVITACQTEESFGGFSIDVREIAMDSEGGTATINVSSGVEWTVGSTQPWITVSPANGVGSTACTVSIDTTLIVGVREGQITFSPKGLSPESVDVTQIGYGNVISLSESTFDIPASANYNSRYFEAKVTTNVEFEMNVEYYQNTEPDPETGDYDTPTGWITPPSVSITFDRGSRPRTATLKFEWKTNTAFVPRACHIDFVPSGDYADSVLVAPAMIDVSQEASPTITDDRAGDSLAILSIRDQLNMMGQIDATEKLQNWSGVTLWEKTDKDLPTDDDGNAITDAIGRVRSAEFYYFTSYESIPSVVKYLKYAESLLFYSNVNSFLRSIDLDSDICELKYLKSLEIGAYGLVSLPDDFYRLDKLEYLAIEQNNFESIPAVLCKENFPNLKTLIMLGNRRHTCSDLRNEGNYDDGIGLHINTSKDETVEGLYRLFMWDTLEDLELNYNYLESNVPDFTVGEEVSYLVNGETKSVTIENYSEDDLTALGDTCAWLVGQYTPEDQLDFDGSSIPKILPNCKMLKLNLNYFTGDCPNWIMYHPYLIEWIPDTFIFNQDEEGKDSNGKVVKFDNDPSGNYTYYYNVYPKYEAKYTYEDELL